MAEAKHKLDVFRLLEAADLRQRDFIYEITEEERKSFVPLVAMRWLSAVAPNGPAAMCYALLTNHYVNKDFWALRDHPELQWMLMSRVGSGKKKRHQWIPMPKQKRSEKLNDFMLQWHPSANDLELAILLNQYTEESFADFARSTGLPDDEVKAIINEYESRNGKSPKVAKGRKAKV